jgi:hypothetical protein
MTAPYVSNPGGVGGMLAQVRRRIATQQPGTGSYGTVADAMGGIDADINRDRNYDASDALNRYAKGAWGSVSQGLQRTLADVRGGAVGAGRFDTGYLDEDQGTVIRDVANDFSNNLAQQSLNAENLTQDVRGRGSDMLWGRAEQVLNDQREQAARKRQGKRGIFGALGTIGGGIIGGLVGGPAGAMAGGKIGGSIGGGF